MPPTPPEKRVGDTLLGKYHLDSILGVGGMASVFAATHRNGARVAIKILRPQLAANEEWRSRFLREGYAANKIDHPGVTRVLDDDVDESGAVFLVMELLEGETLGACWQRSNMRLPLEEVLIHMDRLLDVLEAAHAKSIIHRDIKPDNVFLTTSGKLKILDFGIARFLDSAGVTKSGVTMGTPGFMAPEQAGGRTREIDCRTDLWSVGALAFTLLTGEIVHGSVNSTALLIVSATRQARRLADVAPAVPSKVAEIIDTALSFESAKRWPSAKMMQYALRTAHSYPVPPRPLADEGVEYPLEPRTPTIRMGSAQ